MLTIHHLLAALDGHDDAVPLERLIRLMRKTDIVPDDLRDCARFDDERYKRNLLRLGSGYAALVLCWKAGQRTPIHDHTGSACGVKVIEGVATETRYERAADGMLIEIQANVYPTGSVCGSYDADIHLLANDQPHDRRLITLHIYTPPLNTYHVYSIDSTDVTACRDMETLAAMHEQPMR